MHVLFLIADMAFAEKNIERDFRIAESATVTGGAFAIVSTVSYRRARKVEEQMLREGNNYNYNELLQTYKGHRNQYIVPVPATIAFSGLAIALYTRRNIQKTTFTTSSPQTKSNTTDATSTVVIDDENKNDNENKTNQEDGIQSEHIEKESLPKYKKILDFMKKEDLSEEVQNKSKEFEPPNKEKDSSDEVVQDEEIDPDDTNQSLEQLDADEQEK